VSAQDDDIEQVIVTGSRIARPDFDSASPIVSVTKELFERSGSNTVESTLNTLPQFVPSYTSTSNNPGNGGQANVSLRGLGPTATLVLVDGKRLMPANGDGVTDLNIIPSSLIESVEIITGGASAVYGSDALAGVVNFKLKRKFDGAEIDDVTSKGRSSVRADLCHATRTNLGNGLHPAEFVGPWPLIDVDDATIVSIRRERDGGERSNDALIRAAEPFEMTRRLGCHRTRLSLGDDFAFRTRRECPHVVRRACRHGEPGIAPFDKERSHLIAYRGEELVARNVVAVRQLNRGRAVSARERHARIEEQLVAADDGASSDRTEPPDNLPRQSVGTRAADDVGVVDADVDHACGSWCLRSLKWNQQSAPNRPAITPESV